MNPETLNRRTLVGLIAALAAWGVYLAVGATGYWANAYSADTSYKKSLIVLFCVAGFLGLWAVTLLVNSRPAATVTDAESLWSIPACLSLALMGGAIGLWVGAIALWSVPPPRTAIYFGWAALTAMGGAGIAAIVGLSEPRKRRGKLAALITLVLFLGCFAVFVWRTANVGSV